MTDIDIIENTIKSKEQYHNMFWDGNDIVLGEKEIIALCHDGKTLALNSGEYSHTLTMDKKLQEEFIQFKNESLDVLLTNITMWAYDCDLQLGKPIKQALKLGEEYGELCEGIVKGKEDLIKDSIGDMFVVLTILCMQIGTSIEECVNLAYNEIKDRKGKMVDGVFVKESDLIKGGNENE